MAHPRKKRQLLRRLRRRRRRHQPPQHPADAPPHPPRSPRPRHRPHQPQRPRQPPRKPPPRNPLTKRNELSKTQTRPLKIQRRLPLSLRKMVRRNPRCRPQLLPRHFHRPDRSRPRLRCGRPQIPRPLRSPQFPTASTPPVQKTARTSPPPNRPPGRK